MKNNNLGLIHIYCGDGKGKTTAATGLALRCAGAGYKVLISRFLKNDNSCELSILNQISNITVVQTKKEFGFFSSMSEEQIIEASEYYSEQLKNAFIDSEYYDMLFLDEINVAVSLGLISEDLLIDLISHKKDNLELVLTGRNPSERVTSLADYVSEIKCIRHPYNQGVTARIGIEK